jgi:hypothetical protein
MKKISAEEFDRIFDEGEEDILQYCDFSVKVNPDINTRTVFFDLPVELFARLDKKAQQIDVPVQAMIRNWVTDIAEKEPAYSD